MLQPERQPRQRTVTTVVERDQLVGIMDLKNQAGAEREQADAEHAREQRDEEPVAEVGDELALAPPRRAGVAGPEMGQHREDQRKRQRDRHQLHDRLAEHLDDFQRQVRHPGLFRARAVQSGNCSCLRPSIRAGYQNSGPSAIAARIRKPASPPQG
jgi:hypothetical protein